MNIHEYQSKQILRQYGLHVPEGYPAFTVEDAVQSAKRLDTPVVVVKAQIHAGGRGTALWGVHQSAEKRAGHASVIHRVTSPRVGGGADRR